MRISDWSSDVCSSDLEMPGPLQEILTAPASPAGYGDDLGRALAALQLQDGLDAFLVRHDDVGDHQVRRVGVEQLDASAAVRGAGIGRASCRERVWQYV